MCVKTVKEKKHPILSDLDPRHTVNQSLIIPASNNPITVADHPSNLIPLDPSTAG